MELKKRLSQDLKDYQSIPFWSWNDELEADELRRQIREMKRPASAASSCTPAAV